MTSTVFKLDRDIIGTNLLTKFHEDRTINVASRVFTNKCGRTDGRRTDGRTTTDGRTDDGQRPVTKGHLSNQVRAPGSGQGMGPSPFLTRFYLFDHLTEFSTTRSPVSQSNFIGTNALTKFHEDWEINQANKSRKTVIFPSSRQPFIYGRLPHPMATRFYYKPLQCVKSAKLLLEENEDST
ncbi:hypothetical protein DPMN_057027 [Dreissena polymorpha]|uniref:Uncharacterized protein n=1 Tax=Dreissena polymorpha TaxID=45954 RepID=A0A9D4HS16_DREPO|nr:hypothetical protein DPMN_057027 [Dreissena polymorpha]